jgi:tight adherence protein B
MNLLIIGVIIFIFSIVIIELLMFAFKNTGYVKSANIKKRLRKFTYVDKDDGTGDIIKKRVISDIPWLNELLLKKPFVTSMDRLIIQANTKYNLGFYLLLTLILGCLGFLFGTFKAFPLILSFLIGLIFATIPFFYLQRLKNKRMEKFRTQLPEGLGLIARSLRAGHAFTSGMKMVSAEFDDPLGTELEETLDEINFGVNVADALKNLADRIDCEEAKFFVTAVVLQRESGGNLATILDSLANIIRKKFEFQDKVNTLSAEARLSAVVLVLLPFVVGSVMYIFNPAFISILFTDPTGHLLLVVGSILMVLGILVIRKIIEIKV